MDEQNLIKILFLSASPEDQKVWKSEHDVFIRKLKNYHKREIELLLSLDSLDYESLLLSLKEDKPNILHFSGRGSEGGVCLKNNKKNGETQFIQNEDLKEIFENRKNYLKLVILNSDFSTYQAEIISKYGFYVIGVNCIIDENIAKSFTELFYLGVIAQELEFFTIEKVLIYGLDNLMLVNPEISEKYSLWLNGKEIIFNKSQKTLEIESIKNLLYKYNYKKQNDFFHKEIDFNRPSFNIFTFDSESKDEAKFLYNLFTSKFNVIDQEPEIIKFSEQLGAKNIEDEIDKCIRLSKRKSKILCIVFNSNKARKDIDNIIGKLVKEPIQLTHHFILLFVSDNFNLDNCKLVPYSALEPEEYENSISNLNTYFSIIKQEFYDWLDRNCAESIINLDKQKCINICEEYFSNFRSAKVYRNSEKKFIFNLLKEFTLEELGYYISFDVNLQLIFENRYLKYY